MKILILANYGMGLFNFRKELLESLIEQKNEVFISLPSDEYMPKLKALGCNFIDTELERRGTNPVKDFSLLLHYVRIINDLKPDIVLTYTIKPNIYGGIACAITKVPYISNITGLGTSIEDKGFIRNITLNLYRLGLRKASCVFFQNRYNRETFINHKIVANNTKLLPGSGVNLDIHKLEEYPANDNQIRLLFVGRIMRSKGIEELLEASKIIKSRYSNVYFDLVGGIEDDYTQSIQEYEKQGFIKYYGKQLNVHSYIQKSHAIILPSYHEGMANVLLESASTGRPIIASRIPGCIETFEENVTGIGFEAKEVNSLVEAICRFIELPYDEKKLMGRAGRRLMESEFDRNIVINTYMKEISIITGEEQYTDVIREVS